MRYNFLDLPCITQLSSNFPIPHSQTYTQTHSHCHTFRYFRHLNYPVPCFISVCCISVASLKFAQVQKEGYSGLVGFCGPFGWLDYVHILRIIIIYGSIYFLNNMFNYKYHFLLLLSHLESFLVFLFLLLFCSIREYLSFVIVLPSLLVCFTVALSISTKHILFARKLNYPFLYSVWLQVYEVVSPSPSPLPSLLCLLRGIFGVEVQAWTWTFLLLYIVNLCSLVWFLVVCSFRFFSFPALDAVSYFQKL